MILNPLVWEHKKIFEVLPYYFRRSADWNFLNCFLWRKEANLCVGEHDNNIILTWASLGKEHMMFSGNVESGVALWQAHDNLCHRQLLFLSEQCHDAGKYTYQWIEDEDRCEYLYLFDNIRGFKGTKLQKKRNHLNYFLAQSESSIEINKPLDLYRQDLLPFFSVEAERTAFEEYLALPPQESLFHIILLLENRVIGFSMGNIVGDTCIVHFEKADKNVRGAYQAIFYYFLEYLADKNIQWINREHDLGQEHLRKSKRSYFPDGCIKKFVFIKESIRN